MPADRDDNPADAPLAINHPVDMPTRLNPLRLRPQSSAGIPAGHRKKRGFTLVVTLSFMILLTILVMGLLQVSAISLRTTTRQMPMLQAKANARMALLIAIGELQKELGPDQRISAGGGQQLEASNSSGRNNWVGVYDSWPATADQRPTPTFRKWLISGEAGVTSTVDAPKTGAALASSTVSLAKATSSSGPVEAGVLKVPDGGYSWWVSDNNMKAKLGNTVVPPTNATEAVARLQAAPRAAHEFLLGTSIPITDPSLNRLISLSTVDILAKPPESIFHDATTIANGLVTNVRAGGFRKDLSFLLEKPYSEAIKDPLYKAGSTNGMHFGELWADHNIWGELKTAGLPAHADGSNLAANTSYLSGPGTLAAAFNDPFRKYHQLTRIQHTIVYSLISRPKPGSTTNEYDLLLVVDPIFTIWNPFNVPVYLPASAYSSFQTWAVPYRLTLQIQKSTGASTTWSATVPQISGTSFNKARVGQAQNLVLRPGEVQVLSQSYQNKLIPGGSIEAKLGWNFGSGFEFSLTVPKKDSSGVVTDPNSLMLPVIKGDDRLTFSLTPAPKGQSHGLGITHARQYIGDEGPYAAGNFSIDWTTVETGTRNGELPADGFPHVFRQIPRDPSYSKGVAEMAVAAGTDGTTKKWPLFVFTMGFRTEEDSYYPDIASLQPSQAPPRYSGKSILHVNPKSFTYDLGDLSPEWTRETAIQVGLRKLTSLNNVIDTAGAGLGYFGASYTAGTGSSYVITQSVPKAPIFSLGTLQNSLADGLPDNATIAANDSNLSRVWYLRPSISHAIANSFAPSVMAPGSTAVTKGSGKYTRDLADHSFLANRALWDDYFFSSISPKSSTAHKNPTTAYGEQKSRLSQFLGLGSTTSVPLPNPRFKPWSSDPQSTLDEIFQGATPKPEAAERTAAHLVVDGAFNVNSTSVNAWKSMLTALKGSMVPVSEPTASSSNPTLTAAPGTPVTGALIAGGGAIGDSDIISCSDPQQWLGFRTVTDTQIDELAKAIVKQVRLRGPFTSLADFINRRPGSNKELALSGALQSALDDNDVSINAPYRSGSRTLDVSEARAQGFEFPEAEAGAKSAGAPGYVKQGDLLTPLAPLITVRSDTFTIRTYGEARDKNNEIVAKAYCEAVVQRFPDYVDPANGPQIVSPVSLINKTFGRKFQIISFRYLNQGEI
ncbi:hypothetical protein [Luteolibacter sp. LG18]|uniref:hypothetical protein n=1 Tax=Luteolibacter sp. LG18 TaxID=2819286 RepID=UPI0030C6F330